MVRVAARSREAVIRATLELIEGEGFSAVNVSSVAAAAGVSRQTVYSIFGSREELVSQAVISVVAETLDAVTAAAEATDTACGYAVELIVAARRELLGRPVLLALLRAERQNPLFDEGMMSRALPLAAARLAPLAVRDPALADPDEFASIVELITRLGMSVAVFDSERIRDDDELRRSLTRWLMPLLAG